MDEVWKTCRQAQVECKGCGKMDSCTVSPDLQAFKCWRNGGAIYRNPGERGSHDSSGYPSYSRATYQTLQIAAESFTKRLGTLAGSWQYHDALGNPVMGVLRFNGIEGKSYRPFHLTADGWVTGDPHGILPLYRLPDVMKATRVFVCEGEKAADAGRKLDLICTTSAHGASSAGKSDWSVLAGKEVIILPDHDEPGLAYAQEVARICLSLTPTPKVMIVELPGMRQGDDLYDWCEYLKELDWKDQRSCIGGYVEQGTWLTLEQLPHKPQPPSPQESTPVITRLAEVKPEAIRWLWEGKLALGKLSGWAGAPGDGKSVASMDVAARVTTGADWPDGGKAVEGSVLLITTEDGLADTIRPRLDAHGANVEKVHHFSMVKRTHNGKTVQELFTLSQIGQIEKALVAIVDCRLVIIDPVGSFFGTDTDSNGDAAVRSVLAPIGILAEKYNISVLLVMHTRKEGGERADDAVMGSRAFTGIVRCMWHVRRDENEPERRLLLPGKNNAVKALLGLAYKVVDSNGTAKVEWEPEPVQMTADEAVKRSKASEGGGGESQEMKLREEIQQWLERQLQGGPRPAGTSKNDEPQPGTLLEDARAMGYYWRSVQRAATAMGVMRAKQGSTTVWLLPSLGE